jgi:hypothetical protein
VLEDLRPTVRALAAAVVPEAARLDPAGWMELERTVERALAPRPPALRRQLRVLLRLLEWLPFLYYGRPLSALDPVRRGRFVAHVQNAPVLLLRRGFWGLRTLLLMGYYTRSAAATEIGYRASRDGWEARR